MSWRENTVCDKVRRAIGVPVSPLWVAATATGQDVGGAEPATVGIFFVFSSMCAFYSEKRDAIPRWAFDSIDEIGAEGDTVRIASGNKLFKLSQLDEHTAVLNAMNYLHTQIQSHIEDITDEERGEIVYPEQTRRSSFLGNKVPGEYVVQHVDGAILTTQRFFFSTSVVKLSAVLMMHPTEEGLKVVVNKTLTILLRCSPFRQQVIVKLWLSTLSISTHHFIPGDPFPGDFAMRSHVTILERLHKQFCAIDISRDGFIAESELSEALGPLFALSNFTNSFFGALDLDNDDVITYNEFASGMTRLLASNVMDRLEFSFRMFDKNKDGSLSEDELYDALRALSSTGDVMVGEDVLREVCDALFTLMDEDGSGHISLEEYKQALNDNIQVHELFRRVGIQTENCTRPDIVEFSDRLITFGDSLWVLSASLMQALLVGVNFFKPRVPKGEVVPITPSAEEFREMQHSPIHIAEEVLQSHGYPSASPIAEPTLVMYSPAVFQTLRQSFGVSFREFEMSLGLDNLVGNMMLGSHNALRKAQFQTESDFTFVSSNELLLLRTMSRPQVTQMLSTLPQYVTFIRNNPNSHLPRYLALYSIMVGGHEMHFSVSLNPIRTRTTLGGVFTFQGLSTRVGGPLRQGRFHEGDLRSPIALAPGWSHPFQSQLKKDCAFLSSVGCIDYELIMGLQTMPLPPAPTSSSSQSGAFKKALESDPQKQKSGGLFSCCKASGVKQSGPPPPRQPQNKNLNIATVETGTVTLEDSTVFTQGLERGLQLPPISVFHEWDGGMRSIDNGTIYFGLTDIHNRASDPAHCNEFEHQITNYCAKWIVGEDEDDCPNLELDPQAITAPVVMENGKKATVAIDPKRKQLFIVSASGKCLLSVNVVLSSHTTAFVRNISLADKFKSKLSIRAGLGKNPRKKKATATYSTERNIAFQSILERERFMSEVHKCNSGGSTVDGLKVGNAKVCVISWNVGDAVPASIEKLMMHARGCDLVVVSTQECNYHAKGQPAHVSCEADWFTRVHAQLPEYEKVAAISLWSIRMIVLVQTRNLHRISNICHATEATGLGSIMGNKGGIAIGLKFDESSMCFIGSHLAAHLERVADRNSDFEEIVEGCSAKMGFQGIDILNAYQHVFWCGDLNYRIDASFPDVVQGATTGEFNKLYPYDQLMLEMDSKRVFQGFTEPAPNFMPTYRFLRDTDKSHPRMYDEWKHRIPSWCDRILHKSLGHPIDSVKRLVYDAEHDVRSSDHSPVFAVFDVSIRQQFCILHQNVPSCALINITNLKCNGLMQADTFGLSDPWIRVLCPFIQTPAKECRTRTIFKTLDPEWTDPLQFQLYPVSALMLSTEYLTFVVYDEDYNGTNDPLGQAVCSLHILAANPAEPYAISLPVMHNGIQRGTLQATLQILFK